jgi:hypothetical protein
MTMKGLRKTKIENLMTITVTMIAASTEYSAVMRVPYLSEVVGDRNFSRWMFNHICHCIHELDSVRRIADEGHISNTFQTLSWRERIREEGMRKQCSGLGKVHVEETLHFFK